MLSPAEKECTLNGKQQVELFYTVEWQTRHCNVDRTCISPRWKPAVLTAVKMTACVIEIQASYSSRDADFILADKTDGPALIACLPYFTTDQ